MSKTSKDKVLEALKNTNEKLVILKKQLNHDEESWLSELIKENEKVISNAE